MNLCVQSRILQSHIDKRSDWDTQFSYFYSRLLNGQQYSANRNTYAPSLGTPLLLPAYSSKHEISTQWCCNIGPHFPTQDQRCKNTLNVSCSLRCSTLYTCIVFSSLIIGMGTRWEQLYRQWWVSKLWVRTWSIILYYIIIIYMSAFTQSFIPISVTWCLF